MILIKKKVLFHTWNFLTILVFPTAFENWKQVYKKYAKNIIIKKIKDDSHLPHTMNCKLSNSH